MKHIFLSLIGVLLPALAVRGADTPEDDFAGFGSSRDYRWTYENNWGRHSIDYSSDVFSGVRTLGEKEYAFFKEAPENGGSDSGYGDYIRQEDGKVYTYILDGDVPLSGKGQEYLLWDFNLEPGDILEGYLRYGTMPQRVIDKWTVDIDGPRRAMRLLVSGDNFYSYPYTVVEGLGAIEYGTMARSGEIDWLSSTSISSSEDEYKCFRTLSSVTDGDGNIIYERGKTLVDYTPLVNEDYVWEYGAGTGDTMVVERMAFRGTRTVNDVEYSCFGTLYRGPRVPVDGIESAVAFNPYLLREEYGKVYLLHTPGSYHLEEDAAESPVESLLYDFTVKEGRDISVFAGGEMTEGTVSVAAPIPFRDIGCLNYTLWEDGPVFMECIGALGGGNLAEFGREDTPDGMTLRYVYNDRGDVEYSAPGLFRLDTKSSYWNYRSYMGGGYVDFTMYFAWSPTEIDGKNYRSFYTEVNKQYDDSANRPALVNTVFTSDERRFLIRQEGGRIMMRVPENREWPFHTVAGGVSEVCLYDYDLDEGDSYDMFTTSGSVKATLSSVRTEKVAGKDTPVQVFLLEGGKTIEVVEGIGNVSRGTFVTIDIDDIYGNPEGVTPADMKNPAEGYPTFLVDVNAFEGGVIYSNEERLLNSVDTVSADGYTAPSDRIYDLQGRELRSPIPGQPYIQGGKIHSGRKYE